ncbi:MAG: hypothetical protein QOF66_4888 [Mycobacterium sp.]|nr:hypothetical protein [Mycobacterium sp.]MDT5056522.1 hypothetical protein [Mycobacterium sp.]
MESMAERKRKRYGPGLPRTRLDDRLWPALHDRWWNWNARKEEHKELSDLADQLYPLATDNHLRSADLTLDQAKAVAQTAVDRAAAADRRATTIAGAVAIAASFTLSGAGVVLGKSSLPDWAVKASAVMIALITVLFVLSAVYALRALAGRRGRTWHWETPYTLERDRVELTDVQRLTKRSADLLNDFAFNWEISDLKNRYVDNALLCLTLALCGVATLSIIVACAVLRY